MCGIFGFSGFKGSEDDAIRFLKKGSDCLIHRGPDDHGEVFLENKGIGFAHRRLSILDTSIRGHQPMSSASGRFLICYNGEVYNFKEIRKQLDSGYSFTGESDTEVLLAAFEKYGVETAVPMFRGMFAMAVYDRSESLLFLVRDRMGIKPLYYGISDSTFCFSSELRALVKSGVFSLKLDEGALSSYLAYNFAAGEQSLISGIRRLNPGSLLKIRCDFTIPEIKTESYWSTSNFSNKTSADESFEPIEWQNRIHEKLKESVELRMVSDVPLGAFLSGGIDSSLIVALMAEKSSRPIKTFTIGMEQQEYDESEYAAEVARQLGCEHLRFEISPSEVFNKVTCAGEFFDEPMADASIIPSLLISEHARKHVTVALTGDGGDEVFGGYNRHFHGSHYFSKSRRLPASFRGFLSSSLSGFANSSLSKHVLGLLKYRSQAEKLEKLSRIIGAKNHQDLYHRLILRNATFDSEDLQQRCIHELSQVNVDHMSVGRKLMTYDLNYYMRYDILPKLDIASMNPSLEARVPLLDHELYELSRSVPDSLLFNSNSGKRVLKSILSDYIDVSFLDRPKAGFAIPLASWLRGSLKDWAKDVLFDSSNENIVERSIIQELWNKSQQSHKNEDSELWPLLLLFSWIRTMKE